MHALLQESTKETEKAKRKERRDRDFCVWNLGPNNTRRSRVGGGEEGDRMHTMCPENRRSER